MQRFLIDTHPPNPFRRARIENAMSIAAQQIVWLFVLAIPIASVAWTITHEEVSANHGQYCQQQSP